MIGNRLRLSRSAARSRTPRLRNFWAFRFTLWIVAGTNPNYRVRSAWKAIIGCVPGLGDSVLIELNRGKMLKLGLALFFQSTMPDLRDRQEIAECSGPILIEFGLRIGELDSTGITLPHGYRQESER